MSRPDILALHGNLGSADDWEPWKFSGLRAINLWQHSDLDFFEMAHLIATELSAGMERPVLAGYSLGGRLALHAMAIHPERWAGAIILSAHSGLECVEDRLARRVSDEIWARKAREMEWSEFLADWNRQGVLSHSPVPSTQLALEGEREGIALAFETWSLGRQENLRSQLRRFHAPVLWITGERDEKFTSLASGMGDVFPDFQHCILRGLGHRVLGEDSASFSLDWLSSATGESPA